MVGLRYHFVIFVVGNGRNMVFGCSRMFNNDCDKSMVTKKVGKHTIEMYDGIDELPIARFHKYQKLLLIDAGIGSDINAFDQRLEKTRRFLMAGKADKAGQEIENLRQCVYLIQTGSNPKHRAFACLVAKIDGKECNDVSDDGLERVLQTLSETPISKLAALFEAAKKKIDAELILYFPRLFDDSEIKEYFDLMKKRTLAILNNIIKDVAEPLGTDAVEKLTTALITYTQPKLFSGSESVEIQYDRQFENLCLALSENLHVDPKKYTALEFYNAFDFLQERAKKAKESERKR